MRRAALDRVDRAEVVPRLNQEKRAFDIEADSIKIFEKRLANQIALGFDDSDRQRLLFVGIWVYVGAAISARKSISGAGWRFRARRFRHVWGHNFSPSRDCRRRPTLAEFNSDAQRSADQLAFVVDTAWTSSKAK